jgi:hypothetical protein
MEIVAFFKCNDHYEARIKEQEYFTSLNATLNSLEPLPKPKPKPIETPQLNKEIKKIYFCETCKITLQNQHLLEVHNQTKKHCKRVMGIETKKVANKFFCEICDFKCCKVGDYKRHILTSKHKNLTVSNGVCDTKNIKHQYICDICKKEYNSRNGLWNHKKTCNVDISNNIVVVKENTNDKDELILMLIKQNSALIKETTDLKNLMIEQQSMMMEVIKNGNGNNSHHH